MSGVIPADLGLDAVAMSLWGKTNLLNEDDWLQVFAHLSDSAAVARYLWRDWVPWGTRQIIIRDVDDPELARKVCMFITGVHDIGKATPVFQSKPLTHAPGMQELSLQWKPRQAGLRFPDVPITDTNYPTHPIAGQRILESYLAQIRHWSKSVAESYACVVGGHHGQPPTRQALCKSDEDVRMGTAQGYEDWVEVQRQLIEFVAEQCELSDDDFARLGRRRLNIYAESVLEGLVIMADWIASNSDNALYPLVPLSPKSYDEQTWERMNSVRTRAGLRTRQERAWRNLDLPPKWQPIHEQISIGERFASRFNLPAGAEPRPVQEQAAHLAETTKDPGIMVIEAPMGEGKTEAALACAEILAERTGRGGVCVALPTMATTDAMFSRCKSWIDRLPQPEGRSEKSISLRHGKAALNREFMSMMTSAKGPATSSVFDEDVPQGSGVQKAVYPEAVVNDWLRGRKKGVLANFLICTIDQVLMAALQMKHVSLRQLALANKVVIIDECHAYDTYMREYLKRILEWLGGFHNPVILLSATLPASLRRELVDAYIKGYASVLGESDSQLEQPPEDAPRRFASMEAFTDRYSKPHIDTTSAPLQPGNKQPDNEEKDSDDLHAYPLITYTSGTTCRTSSVQPSGRAVDIDCHVVDDDLEQLSDLLQDRLAEGGCAAVICDTVDRAQQTAAALTDVFGPDQIRLTHSRFIDRDRMDNERELRERLGPDATLANGGRPHRLIVVGTQVLEQSLDIDFDLMVTDIAPVDLLLQRMGRLHRHRRGQGENDRPAGLRKAFCYLRGIASWNTYGPVFPDYVDSVYPSASLLEALAVLCLQGDGAHRLLQLPDDIAPLVRTAYDSDAVAQLIPKAWQKRYRLDAHKRTEKDTEEIDKAQVYLMKDPSRLLCQSHTLVDLFTSTVDASSEAKARQAVRDTHDSVEVVLLRRCGDEYALLPWIGGDTVPCGAPVPTNTEPENRLAQVVLRCAVNLPDRICRDIDALINELEIRAGDCVDAWHQSPWLDGCLPLVLDEEESDSDRRRFVTTVHGYLIGYTREDGLTCVKVDEDEKS